MNTENIGTWAGLVWNALNDAKKALTTKELRKVSKLKVNEMHCALGWLAKEGKLNFKEGKDDIEVSLR
ncbi:MAG: winged helix-turn-helix domain-containing protein [Muribaculaceae bacterium]|nr:winged helix-turn-helix domain-containing protein [Muribaculaceae bacterium]